MSRTIRVGVDVGGTFTDLAMYDAQRVLLAKEKVLTTPDDPSVGVLEGIDRLLRQVSVDPSQVSHVIHGTTLVANALIERKGSKLALITTAGFRDVLEIGREMRYDTYDLAIEMPLPLVERDLRFEVRERIAADGTLVEPLDTSSLDLAVETIRERGIEAVGVCLLHAYRNDDHERQVRDYLRERLPGLVVAISSEVMPEIGEYERTSTTLCNAYVQPLFDRYIAVLARGLATRQLDGGLYLMLSDGGTMHPDAARAFPIRLVQSGPAGGVEAAAMMGRLLGDDRVLCFDMGGTTAKACLIEDASPARTTHFEVARVWRFKKGSGLPLRVPVVNMIEIGAGGGSIAQIDNLGFTQVGPESASSKPGPACYGLGGKQPTVTDADLVLGYLAADRFLGGDMRLDTAAATAAIDEHVGRPIGLSTVDAAWSIFETVTESMAQATMIHALEMGKRLNDYAMVAIGGAGPVHAIAIARRLGIRRVVCPAGAGVASAFGFLVASMSFESVRSDVSPLALLDADRIRSLLAEMEDRGRALLAEAGLAPDSVRLRHRCAVRYSGQGHAIEVDVPAAFLHDGRPAALKAAFEQAYQAMYGRVETSGDIEVISWMVKAAGPESGFQLPKHDPSGQPGSARRGTRPVYFRESRGFLDSAVYDRQGLHAGEVCVGPAVIEERESTLIVPPGWRATADAYNNLVAEPVDQP